MRKTTLLASLILFCFNYIAAQCPVGPIVLSTQADIDNFAINYPGCTQLTDNLTISGSTIENLNGLNSITSIDGDFVITANGLLHRATGLENLTTISGKFEVSGTLFYDCLGLGSLTTIGGDFVARSIKRFSGLDSLTTIGGSLDAELNYQIISLMGLDVLTTIGGDLKFKNNTRLTSLSGANSLESIGGNFIVFNISYNVLDFDGFQNLESIGGNLDITNQLSSFNGLDALTSIGGNLDLNTNSKITDMDGLLSLQSIGGDFIITNGKIETMNSATLQTIGGSLLINNCDFLTNIDFSDISEIGGYMAVFDNNILNSIAGFNSLTSIGDYFKIYGNSQLATIPEFNTLSNLGGDLILNNNYSLLTVTGFESLTNLPGSIEITGSINLHTISGFNNVETISSGLLLSGNTNLVTLDGFSSLLSVGSDFNLNNNNHLINFSGFSSVTEITGSFSINSNPALQSINTFNSLETVGSFSIKTNSNLNTINGFNSIATIHGDFSIENNQSLSNINPFPLVSTVEGDFIFSSNSIASTFQGFETLATIGGDMRFSTCPFLGSLPNFNTLTSIGGNVLFDRVSIGNLNTLTQLTSIGGSLRFNNMDSFQDVEGLNNLLTIGGELYMGKCKINTGFDSLITIGGDLSYRYITFVPQFQGFDSLESIGGTFYLFDIDFDFEYFYWPPNLTTVGGGISVIGCDGLKEIPGMNVLTSLGDFITFYQSAVNKIEMNSLVDIPGNVEIIRNGLNHVSFSSLENVSGHFEIEQMTTYLNLDNLTTVGDYFRLEDLGNGTAVNLIMNSITSIGGDVTLIGTLSSLSGWQNVTTINGNLYLDSTYNMPGLYGLEGLTTITGDCLIRGDFSTYSGLDNLTSIGGNFNTVPTQYGTSQGDPVIDFTGLGQLNSIGGNFRISGIMESLNGISSLETVGGDLQLDYNTWLQNFVGLENLHSVNGELIIKENYSLTSLEGLNNLDYNLLDYLNISFNDNLSMCSILPVCGYLQSSTDYNIYSNRSDCNTDTEILSLCNYNTILGNIRYDFDTNGCDQSDYNASSLLVDVTNGVNNYRTLTNEDGSYVVFVGEGTFTTTINSESLPANFEAAPASVTTVFTGNGNEDTADFCLTATTVFDDLRVSILPLDAARPGFDSEYLIVYENLGTQPLDGEVSLQFDDSRQGFLIADPSQTSINGNLISWDFTDLVPFQSREIRAVFNTFPPPINQGDDVLQFSAIINPISSDINPDNNVADLNQIIVNSYDPNDKQVAQGVSIFIEEASEYLDYVVRFQNTGTANATTVKISDQLSDNLNWNTVRTLSSSHDYRVEIRNDNEVYFIFENIDLPPESTDPEASKGYIAFQVLPMLDLQIGDFVNNTANIFFDFNPPIITNTVTTTIIDELSVPENSWKELSLFPVPTKGNVSIKYNGTIQQIDIYNELGQLLLKQFNPNGIYFIETEKLSNGIYFVKLRDDKAKETVKKLIKN
ncbi:T9SS type A sorting domain-containing protein [Aequorivita todarodis]|uniref:DUF7619 domain-containing protein n=1 Tax=Aequorivita todarodis TaxID=2036821 RepID=UPI002350A748|nr:T9SS type A sorting domain-containing protein [Aequorivita todarodis]MDC8000633.1 T9SS type A sorting domain-containing protein [Aequorivita todarodis]